MFADLAVQHAQRIEYVVVQIAAKYEWQHGAAQGAGAAVQHAVGWRNHAAFEPGKTFPLTALHVEIFLQSRQRDRGRAGVPVGPQCEIHPEHKTMLRGVADQAVDLAHRLAKVFVVGQAVATLRIARGLAIAVIDVDEIDVTGDVEFTRAEFAHSDNPQPGALAVVGTGSAMGRIEHNLHMGPGAVQREAGQRGHRLRDVMQRLVLVTVAHQQALQHQLAQDAQARTQIMAALHQRVQRGGAMLQRWNARCQQVQQGFVAAAHALAKTRVGRQGGVGCGQILRLAHGDQAGYPGLGRNSDAGHNS